MRGRRYEEDGKFWMPWREFCNYFDMVDVCAPSSSMKDLELDLNEDKGKVCGLVCGATKGCCCSGAQQDVGATVVPAAGCLGPRRMVSSQEHKQILLENGI